MLGDGADDGLRGQDGAADEQHVRLLLAERVDAREEADPAAGAVVRVGFFGFTTTFFSGALRLVPAAAAAVFFGLAVAALFFSFAAALAGLAATVLAAADLVWEPPSWPRRSRARRTEGAAALGRPQGRLGSIGITTLTPLFCLGVNRFGPWALERVGATSREGRTDPLSG